MKKDGGRLHSPYCQLFSHKTANMSENFINQVRTIEGRHHEDQREEYFYIFYFFDRAEMQATNEEL